MLRLLYAMTNSFVEYIETTCAFFATGLKGSRVMIFLSLLQQRGVDVGIGNEISLKYALGERRGTQTIKSAFDFSCALSWSVGSQTCLLLLSRPQNYRQPRDDATVPRCWVALLIFLDDGRNSLFRTLYNGQTWSSGVRPSCSYEMAGMWRELINRLLAWFPQYVTEKTELTLVYR